MERERGGVDRSLRYRGLFKATIFSILPGALHSMELLNPCGILVYPVLSFSQATHQKITVSFVMDDGLFVRVIIGRIPSGRFQNVKVVIEEET